MAKVLVIAMIGIVFIAGLIGYELWKEKQGDEDDRD